MSILKRYLTTSERKRSTVCLELMSYHFNREKGPQTLKYKKYPGILKEANWSCSNKSVKLILQICFVFFFSCFMCQMVGALTEGFLMLSSFQSFSYMSINIVGICTMAWCDNATHPWSPHNLLEYMSFSTPQSRFAESSATKSKSHWRGRKFKTNSLAHEHTYF